MWATHNIPLALQEHHRIDSHLQLCVWQVDISKVFYFKAINLPSFLSFSLALFPFAPLTSFVVVWWKAWRYRLRLPHSIITLGCVPQLFTPTWGYMPTSIATPPGQRKGCPYQTFSLPLLFLHLFFSLFLSSIIVMICGITIIVFSKKRVRYVCHKSVLRYVLYPSIL